MDVGVCGVLGINVHDVFLELNSCFIEEPLIVSAVSAEGLINQNTQVGSHAGIVKGTCLKEGPQDDGSEGGGVDNQWELPGVDEGIAGGGEPLVVAVDVHLIVQLVGNLKWTVRKDLRKVWMECTRHKDGVTGVIGLDGPSGKQPMHQGIALQSLVMMFFGIDGCHGRGCSWRSG